MGVYIEYVDWMQKWHVFGSMGYGFYDTEEEAKAVYAKLLKKLLAALDKRRVM